MMTFDRVDFSNEAWPVRITFYTHLERGSENAARLEEVILEALRRYSEDTENPNFAAKAIAWDVIQDR